MNREYHKGYSQELHRDMDALVFGHAGMPLLVFPTSMGKFFEYEDRGMIGVLAPKIERGDLQVAISTNGKSPALAQRLRQELETEFGPEYEVWLQWLGAAREILRESDPRPETAKKLLHELASRPMFEEFLRQATRHPGHRGAA